MCSLVLSYSCPISLAWLFCFKYTKICHYVAFSQSCHPANVLRFVSGKWICFLRAVSSIPQNPLTPLPALHPLPLVLIPSCCVCLFCCLMLPVPPCACLSCCLYWPTVPVCPVLLDASTQSQTCQGNIVKTLCKLWHSCTINNHLYNIFLYFHLQGWFITFFNLLNMTDLIATKAFTTQWQ